VQKQSAASGNQRDQEQQQIIGPRINANKREFKQKMGKGGALISFFFPSPSLSLLRLKHYSISNVAVSPNQSSAELWLDAEPRESCIDRACASQQGISS
jgi:hypothetical protein